MIYITDDTHDHIDIHKIKTEDFPIQSELTNSDYFIVCGYCGMVWGGASSHDKQYRKEGVTWWSQELPSLEEYDEATYNQNRHNWKVDYVITHCGPPSLQAYFGFGCYGRNKLTDYFDSLYDKLEWDTWYLGHYHCDERNGKYRVLYRDITEISI